jgi:hypothetical protein
LRLPGVSLRLTRLILSLTIISFSLQADLHAQSFTFDLNDLSEYLAGESWDTLGPGQITHLILGEYHRVPNVLPHDFSRVRIREEYSPGGKFRVTFRVPNISTFDFEEEKDGTFIVMKVRDLDTPGLSLSLQSIDDVAEKVRYSTTRTVWASAIKTGIATQKEEVRARKGLNVSIPIPLPGAVEKLIGKGEKTHIDITGRESITFAGETRRVDPFIGVEGQRKQPLFPSLDMKQELDVRLNGTIGEKINVQVDHSSAGLGANNNRIRLNYRGFEDDIIKYIELGNTSLSLPGSQLVSFSTSAQGLFGIKALAQVGPLDVTMIASKEEGEVSRATFTPRGGTIGQTERRSIRDYQYVTNTYFFLDKPDPPPSITLRYGNVFFRPLEDSIEVFQSVQPFEIAANPELIRYAGKAWVDSAGRGDDIRAALDSIANGGEPPPFEDREFKELVAGEDYRFVLDAVDQSVLGIELVRSIPNSEVLAVRYKNEAGDIIGDYGNFTAPLALELIKPFEPNPDDYTWSYMMRNIYNLGLSNIDAATLEVDILDDSPRLDPSTPEGSPIPWIRIFGLDQTDESGEGPPDARIDLTSGLIDLTRGILTIPSLRGFDPDSVSVAQWTNGEFSFSDQPKDLRVPEIYDEISNRIAEFSRFTIVVEAASTSKTFSLNAFNIEENSEVVKLDGRTLSRGGDYVIDYETGEVELRGDVLGELTPSSNITIDYEFKPLAGGASSSLIGFNTLLTLSKNSKIGGTWLYESTGTGTERPRLGEEPTRTFVGNVYGNLSYNPQFLTSLVNVLPLVNTNAQSSMSLNGEIAMSVPDPNTRGEVYIDDMEGVEDSDVISLTRRGWYDASPPIDPQDGSTVLDADKRMRVFWYNIEPDLGVHRRDLNPDLDERESTLVPSLDIEFDTLTVDSSSWAGVMTGFRGGGLDLSRGQFIEVWVNDFKPDTNDRGGVLRIDMGNIDEDFYDPGANFFNREDKNRDGFNALTEDTGLDGIFDGSEGDDPLDNYTPERIEGRFIRINGTEKNFLEDGEDLDGNGQMETSNYFFSFILDLADSAVVDVRRDFPTYSGFNDPNHAKDSWRLYRIDLSDYIEIRKDGTPNFEQIRHLRIWMDRTDQVISQSTKRFQISGLKIVGNRWETDGIRDLDGNLLSGVDTLGVGFGIGVISTKTDPVAYDPPVRPNEQNEIVDKEQSLLLEYEGLPPRTSLRIRKRFAGRGQDYTRYRDLNFFVHADPTTFNDSLEYFFQVAFDSLNFYEVVIPVRSDFFEANGWIQAAVDLIDLTSLKFLPPDSNDVVTDTAPDLIDPGRVYPIRMVGNPNLFNVRFLYAGLRNTDSDKTSSGQMWLNDIYLGNRKKDIDFAQRLSTNINMGNVINFSGSWNRTGPDFHGLRQRRGSGTDNRALSLNVRTGLQHFVPLFGFKIPVSGNYQVTTALPKFRPNSDTEITEKSLQDSLKTESSIRSFSTTLLRQGSKNPIMKYTFDNMKANFSMSQRRSRSPSSADTSLTMNGTLDYSIRWGRGKDIRVFKDFRFRYWFSSLNYRINATRRTGTRYRNVGGALLADPKQFSAALNQSGSVTYQPFASLNTNFRMETRRDVRLPHKFLGIDIGTEVSRSQSFQANYKPPPVWILSSIAPDFSYSSSYSEDASPNVRRAGDPAGVRNINGGRNASVKFRLDVAQYIKEIFGRVGFGGGEREKEKGAGGEGGELRYEAAPADTTKRGGAKDPLALFKSLGRSVTRIRKINASIQHRAQNSYSRIPGRPSLAYQLGFTDAAGIVSDGERLDDPERRNESISLSMDSGTQITNNIDVAGRFSTSRTKNFFRDSDTRSKSRSWPDLNLNWKGLEKVGPFRGLFTATTATVGYKKTHRESGRGEVVDNIVETTRWLPTMVFQLKNGISSTLSMQYSKNTTESRGSLNETSNLGVSMDMKYTFQPGKGFKLPLPFLRNKKLKSRLNSSLNVGYTRTQGKRSVGGSAFFEPIPGTTSLRVSPRFTYSFSQALNGSFFVQYTRNYSEASNQTTTIVRVGITAVFTF